MIVDRVYRALLWLLPRDFDRDDMWETFQARIDDRRRGAGARGAATQRLRELLDLAKTLIMARSPLPSLDSLAQDLRIGLRSLRRSPLASGLAVLSLALGVGATTAIYSVVDPIVLRPLPLPNADRLVGVWMDSDRGGAYASFTVRDYGRWFGVGVDGPGDAPVAVVSRALASRWWDAPAEALGHELRMGEQTRTIVGVVDPGRLRGPVEPSPPAVFVPFAQAPVRSTFNIVPHSMDQDAAERAVREVVREVDPGLAVYDAQSIESMRDDALGPLSAGARVFTSLEVLALVLTLGGVFGIVAHSVARRTHEVGVRLALGAPRRSVVGAMVWRSCRLALVGIAVGVAVSLAGGRVLSFFLYGVSARDPRVVATVPLLLMGVVAIAAYVPARRAARIDPVETLRAE